MTDWYQKFAFGPYGPNDDCVTCADDKSWKDEKDQRYKGHINLPLPWSQINPALGYSWKKGLY